MPSILELADRLGDIEESSDVNISIPFRLRVPPLR